MFVLLISYEKHWPYTDINIAIVYKNDFLPRLRWE